MRLTTLYIIAFVASWSFVSSLYSSNNNSNIQQGGVYMTEITQNEYEQDLFINNQQLLTWKDKNKFYLIYGVPYSSQIKQYTYKVQNKNKATLKKITINVIKKDFKTQRIKVNKKYTSPSKDIMQKIKKDRIKLSKAREVWLDINPDLDFILPVKGITTGVFGTKRFYNDVEGNYHNGFDIAADIGSPIVAPTSGKVILTGNFFYNGKSIILDHGRGLKSIMIHLDKILVKKNEYIDKGQIIGRVGTTGKSTGPHLHWSLLVNNTYIDPELLLNRRIIKNLNLEGS